MAGQFSTVLYMYATLNAYLIVDVTCSWTQPINVTGTYVNREPIYRFQLTTAL